MLYVLICAFTLHASNDIFVNLDIVVYMFYVATAISSAVLIDRVYLTINTLE